MEKTVRFTSARCESMDQHEFTMTMSWAGEDDTTVDLEISVGESLRVKRAGFLKNDQLAECVSNLQTLTASGIGRVDLKDYEYGWELSIEGDGRNYSIDWWVNLWTDEIDKGIRVAVQSIPLEPVAVAVLYEALRDWNHLVS
jgi:hypothetical protein